MTIHKQASRIVIIGANFAGLSCASKLSKTADVTVIDCNEQFQWTPNIHEIVSDVKKDIGLQLDLSSLISSLGHKFVTSKVDSIDTKLQTLSINDGTVRPYDVLVIASGHVHTTFGIKGAEEFSTAFKNAKQAISIYEDIDNALKHHEHIAVNIIGGGFTGVEVMGELLRKHAQSNRLYINLIESKARLLNTLPAKLSDDIMNQCEEHQVNFHFNQDILELTKDGVICSTGNDDSVNTAQATLLRSHINIWTAGTTLPDYIQTLDVPKNASGISVNEYLQIPSHPNVFVVGDAANTQANIAKQASNAMDMGELAAKNVARFITNQTLTPFKPATKPVLLSLGDINTYFIQGNLVLASPLLATAKEAVYQLWMAHLSKSLPISENLAGIASRFTLATEKLLLTEIMKARPRVLIGKSKLLL